MTASWLPLGTNFYRIIDDVIQIDLHGHFTLADAHEYVAMLNAMAQQFGYTLTLFNLSDGEQLSAEVRRFIGQYSNQSETPAGIATVGGSATQRMFGRLVIRGINLFRKSPLAVGFLDHEKDAQAWLQGRRLQIRK